MALVCTSCGEPQAAAPSPPANCEFVRIANLQHRVFLQDTYYFTNIRLTLVNTSSSEIREAEVQVELLNSTQTIIGTLVLKTGVIPSRGQTDISGIRAAILEPTDFRARVTACRVAPEAALAQGNVTLAMADQARAAGDLQLAETILEQLATSQPSAVVTDRLADVRFDLALADLDRDKWDTAEKNLRWTFTVRNTDPEVIAAIRMAMTKRNFPFLIIGIMAVLVMALRGVVVRK